MSLEIKSTDHYAIVVEIVVYHFTQAYHNLFLLFCVLLLFCLTIAITFMLRVAFEMWTAMTKRNFLVSNGSLRNGSDGKIGDYDTERFLISLVLYLRLLHLSFWFFLVDCSFLKGKLWKKRKVVNWKIARSKLFDRKLLNGKRVKMANCQQLIIRPGNSSAFRRMFMSWDLQATEKKTLTFIHCQENIFNAHFRVLAMTKAKKKESNLRNNFFGRGLWWNCT